jgi:peptidyl-prolyl cis-trans isomerase D
MKKENPIKDEVWRTYVKTINIKRSKKIWLTVSKAEIQAIIDAG